MLATFLVGVLLAMSTNVKAAALSELWGRTYDGPPGDARDTVFDVRGDPEGDVIVTGTSDGDIVTLKYNGGTGNLVWLRRFDGQDALDDSVTGLAVDADGDIILTGHSERKTGGYYYYVAKYGGSTGDVLWEKYGGSASDFPTFRIPPHLDENGDIFWAGITQDRPNSLMYTAKLSGENGEILWEVPYADSNLPFTAAFVSTLDAEGNVVVGGIYQHALYTVKYRGTDGTRLWENHSGLGGLVSSPVSIATDNSGDVLVLAEVLETGSGPGFLTVKYAREDGGLLWERRYEGEGYVEDRPTAIVVDSAGDVYVGGSSGEDLYMAKYGAVSGSVSWEYRETGSQNLGSAVAGFRFDSDGSLIVIGRLNSGSYLAIMDASNGSFKWRKTDLSASRIDTDISGNLLVAASPTRISKGVSDYVIHTAKRSGLDGSIIWEHSHPTAG